MGNRGEEMLETEKRDNRREMGIAEDRAGFFLTEAILVVWTRKREYDTKNRKRIRARRLNEAKTKAEKKKTTARKVGKSQEFFEEASGKRKKELNNRSLKKIKIYNNNK